MYMIIYWDTKNELYPVINENNTVKLFDTVKEADDYAEKIEKLSALPLNQEGVGIRQKECRVISIDGVKE